MVIIRVQFTLFAVFHVKHTSSEKEIAFLNFCFFFLIGKLFFLWVVRTYIHTTYFFYILHYKMHIRRKFTIINQYESLSIDCQEIKSCIFFMLHKNFSLEFNPLPRIHWIYVVCIIGTYVTSYNPNEWQ